MHKKNTKRWCFSSYRIPILTIGSAELNCGVNVRREYMQRKPDLRLPSFATSLLFRRHTSIEQPIWIEFLLYCAANTHFLMHYFHSSAFIRKAEVVIIPFNNILTPKFNLISHHLYAIL